MATIYQQRAGKRSTSLAWKCSACFHVMRTPIRTAVPLTRRCHCAPPRVWTFGPTAGGGAYLSVTVPVVAKGGAA